MSTTCRRALFSLFIICISAPTFAADIDWVGNQSDHMVLNGAASFHDGNNWYNYVPPGIGDDAGFGSGFDPQSSGTLPHYIYFGAFQTSYAPPASSPFIPAADAVVRDVIVADGADWTFDFGSNVTGPVPEPVHGNLAASLLVVGGPKIDATPGDASLRLVGDGAAQINNVLVGVLPNMQGALSVGPEVLLDVGQGLGVGGVNAIGELTVYGGGEIQLDLDGDGAGIVVGEGNGAIGSVVVRGAGSKIRGGTQSGMTVGGIFHTPLTGNGSFMIEDGGTVELGQWGVFLGESQARGSLTVQDPGSQLIVGGILVVANGGEGDLLIRNGASVSNTAATIGGHAEAVGAAIVEGENSVWTSTGEVNIGYFGQGSLTIRDGAHVTGEFFSVIGRAGTAVGEVLVTGADSTWTTPIFVGDQGKGTLDVEDGAKVYSRGGTIGNQAGSVGTVTVDGAGSALVVDSPGADDFNIGWSGEAELTIRGGGVVSHQNGNAIIGRAFGSKGKVTVTGDGSTWQSDSLFIASNDSTPGVTTPAEGSMIIEAGATASVATDVHVGFFGAGELTVSAGELQSAGGVVGQFGGALGKVTISDEAGSWRVAANLNIGEQGDGDVVVYNNGTLAVGGVLKLGNQGALNHADNGIVTVGNGPAPAPGTLRVGSGGTLAGSGEITGNVLIDGGTVSPGASPGALKITGNYNQLPTSVLLMEIGGTTPAVQYDQLLVTGDLALQGLVQVSFINGFLPQVGDTFGLFSAGGDFTPPAALTFLNAPPAFGYSSAFENGVFSLTVTAVPEPHSLLLVGLAAAGGFFGCRRRAGHIRQSQTGGCNS